jgi:dTDP-4-dehydrorhamnose reductase
MRILLLGHKGYLGSYLHRNLSYTHDVEPEQERYDYIINCIGKPNLEYCEENPEISKVSNYTVITPYIEKYPECKIINFSSYYVYDDSGFCCESANVTTDYVYTLHNLMCEYVVTRNQGVTFRLGKLFGNVDYFGKGKLTDYIIQNIEMTLDTVRFNPISVAQVKKVVDYQLENHYMVGVYNLSNDSYTTHYEYGKFINDFFNKSKNIKKIEKMKRSFHNYDKCLMSVDKLKNDMSLTNWKVDLERYLKEIQCIV